MGMFRVSSSTILVAAAFVLAACGGSGVNPGVTSPAYHRSVVSSAISNGGMPVVVHGGATTTLDQAATQQIIVTQVQLPGWLPPDRLVLADGQPQRRLVFIVNPQAIGRAANRGCGPLEGIATSPDGELINVAGAFCDETDVLSFTKGSAPVGEAPATALADLVQQITLTLLPPENPVQRRSMFYDGGP